MGIQTIRRFSIQIWRVYVSVFSFCPALKVLSKVLGMNEHLAGVTILAFGNGSPDLFTCLAAVNDNSRLLFSDSMGAAMYVLSFVASIICVLHPFKIQAANILRDVCFFMLGVLFIDYAMITDSAVTVWESAGEFLKRFVKIDDFF